MRTICERIRDRMTRFLDDELPVEEREELEGHLRSCDPCRREIEAIESFGSLWREPPSLPSEAADRAAIVTAARRLLEVGPGWITRLRIRLTPTDLVTAGAVAASLVLAVLLYEGREAGRPAAGTPRSSTVYSPAELRAWEAGRPIEIDAGQEWNGLS